MFEKKDKIDWKNGKVFGKSKATKKLNWTNVFEKRLKNERMFKKKLKKCLKNYWQVRKMSEKKNGKLTEKKRKIFEEKALQAKPVRIWGWWSGKQAVTLDIELVWWWTW